MNYWLIYYNWTGVKLLLSLGSYVTKRLNQTNQVSGKNNKRLNLSTCLFIKICMKYLKIPVYHKYYPRETIKTQRFTK